jgi:hypothetical protein
VSQIEKDSPAMQFNEWLAHPLTVRLRHLLQDQLAELQEQWSSGAFTDGSMEKMALLNANAVGQCEVIRLLLDLEANQLISEEND